MISKTSELRLHATLSGMLPAAVLVLLGATLLKVKTDVIDGVAVSLAWVGLALGVFIGVPMGRLLRKRSLTSADRVLPLISGLVFLLLALAPIEPATFFPDGKATQNLTSVLGCVSAALPLGICIGCSLIFRRSKTELCGRDQKLFTGIGIGLGSIMALMSVLTVSLLQAAGLVNLVVAPVVWPILPMRGERSMLARMLLTLVVVISTMFLLFP